MVILVVNVHGSNVYHPFVSVKQQLSTPTFIPYNNCRQKRTRFEINISFHTLTNKLNMIHEELKYDVLLSFFRYILGQITHKSKQKKTDVPSD